MQQAREEVQEPPRMQEQRSAPEQVHCQISYWMVSTASVTRNAHGSTPAATRLDISEPYDAPVPTIKSNNQLSGDSEVSGWIFVENVAVLVHMKAFKFTQSGVVRDYSRILR